MLQLYYTYILAITYSNTNNSQSTLYKIGCSSNVTKRVIALSNSEKPSSVVRGKGIILHNITILATATILDMSEAYRYEKSLHTKHKHYRYNGSPILPNGNSELYTTNIAAIELIDRTSLFTKYIEPPIPVLIGPPRSLIPKRGNLQCLCTPLERIRLPTSHVDTCPRVGIPVTDKHSHR